MQHCRQTITTSIAIFKFFYRLDALIATQPIVLKHWRQMVISCARGCHNMPPPLWPWPFDLESGARVTWSTSVTILVALGLSVLNLGPMYATDRRQTDRQTSDSIIT